MKIGIIGLLPQQVRDVRSRFPTANIEFLPRERERGPEIRAFSQGCERVLLMGKFISHSTSEAVDRSRRYMVTGGVTSLCSYLRQFFPMATESRAVGAKTKQNRAALPPAPPAPPVSAPIEPAVADTVTQPTQIPHAPSVCRIEAVRGRFNWSLLDALQEGDSVIVVQPAELPIAMFKSRLASARRRWETLSGITLESKECDDGVELHYPANAQRQNLLHGGFTSKSEKVLWATTCASALKLGHSEEEAIAIADATVDFRRSSR